MKDEKKEGCYVAYDGLYLWKTFDKETEAKEFAARFKGGKVRHFKYRAGDRVKDKSGKEYTISRPAESVTGLFGYVMEHSVSSFIEECDLV